MDELEACLRALALELLSEAQREVCARFASSDGAGPGMVERVFGVIGSHPRAAAD